MRHRFIFFTSIVMLLSFSIVSCKTDEGGKGKETSTSDTSSFLASAPALDMDIQRVAIDEQSASSVYSKNSGIFHPANDVGDPSVGGCMAWSVRKNAIRAAAKMQELSCAFRYMATHYPELFSDQVNYFNFVGYSEGEDLKVRISLENNTATASVCMPNPSGSIPASANGEIVASLVADNEYDVQGRLISEYPEDQSTGAKPIRYFEEKLEARSDGTETFSYFDYWKNETDAATCSGTSGTSDDTDNTCFLSLAGSFFNDKEALNPYSVMTGNFAEKNNDAVRTAAAVHAYLANSQGQSKFTAGLPDVNSDVNADTSSDVWSPAEFKQVTGTANMVDESLPARRTDLPVVENSWNCEADGEFVEIPSQYSLPVIEACRVSKMEFADITSCTDPAEISNAITEILSDPCDPILSDMSSCGNGAE